MKATIENMTARFWTGKELNQTKKQAIANGFTVNKDSMGMVRIRDGEKLILQAIPMGANRSVLFDKSYFEQEK